MLELNKPFLKRSVLLIFDWTYLGHFIIEFALYVFGLFRWIFCWNFSSLNFYSFFFFVFFPFFSSDFYIKFFSLDFFIEFFFSCKKSWLNERWIETDPCTFYWSLFLELKTIFHVNVWIFMCFFKWTPSNNLWARLSLRKFLTNSWTNSKIVIFTHGIPLS